MEGIDGAGKSVLVAGLAARLGDAGLSALVTRLSPTMAGIFRSMVDRSTHGAARYQDVLPGDFRRAAYIVDAVAQFHHLAAVHARHDWLLFDRWLPTYDVYGSGAGRHDAHYRRLAGTLPRPDVLLHLRVAPSVAQERIRSRGDWTVDHWSTQQLQADLERLDAAYRREFAGRTDVVTVDGEGSATEVCAAVLALMGVGSMAVGAGTGGAA